MKGNFPDKEHVSNTNETIEACGVASTIYEETSCHLRPKSSLWIVEVLYNSYAFGFYSTGLETLSTNVLKIPLKSLLLGAVYLAYDSAVNSKNFESEAKTDTLSFS